MIENALSVMELDVAYGPVPAVRGLSLRVEPGEIVGLIGPNGAGKSTTLHAIVGLVRAQGGDVLLGGRSLRGRSPEAIARAGVALVPEGRRLFAELTVEENLRLGLAARRENGSVRDALAEGAPREIRANLDVAAAYLGDSAIHEDA
jgi:branched-chain amino acid transport system ATP-binding protein